MDDLYGALTEQAEAEGLTLAQFLRTLPPAELLLIKAKAERERAALLAEYRRMSRDPSPA